MEIETINKSQKFEWTPKKLEVAKALSSGIEKQKDIATRFDIAQETLSRYKSHPQFMEKVDEFTLKNELATRAGLLREAIKGLRIKEAKIDSDRSTHIDYLKQVSDLAGVREEADDRGARVVSISIINHFSELEPFEEKKTEKVIDVKSTEKTQNI